MSKYKHPVAEANESSPFGSLTPAEFYAHHGVTHASDYITSKQSLKLFTQWWTPQDSTPSKASSASCMATPVIPAGSSSSQPYTSPNTASPSAPSTTWATASPKGSSLICRTSVPSWMSASCFSMAFARDTMRKLPAFLYAESLGGAIALLITLRRDGIVPERRFDGVVLNGAMCGISDKFKPPWPLEHFLSIAAFLVPTWCVVPTRGTLPNVSFK
ncbi:UNVERIFIED_CONTAM: hypothetical protein Sradi_6176800, partial [Sesamum radiatum]